VRACVAVSCVAVAISDGLFRYAIEVVPQRSTGQDRAAVVRIDGVGVIDDVTQGAPTGRAWAELLATARAQGRGVAECSGAENGSAT
jgi:hypothetical protein